MPMISRGVGEFTKFRLVISGWSNSGKTHSLITFLYGRYDYWNEEEHADAVSYADGKSMVIMSCPGEDGYRSLPEETEHLSTYYFEQVSDADTTDVEYSRHALNDFDHLLKEVEKNKPDILFLDGVHCLYDHMFNDISDGQWLSGVELNTNPNGTQNKYRGAYLHDRAQKAFIEYLAKRHASHVPLLGMTVWEDWKAQQTEGERAGTIEATRYLWPALAGAMATKMPGKFDARVSARLSKRCYHPNCERSKRSEEHYVWQFLPRDEVRGIGIKGLRPTQGMIDSPFIHQSWPTLQSLMRRV